MHISRTSRNIWFKKEVIRSFCESECHAYFEEIEQKIEDRDGKCHNCKKDIDIDQIDYGLGYNFMSCIDCDLFYCVRCVKTCSNCNNNYFLVMKQVNYLRIK